MVTFEKDSRCAAFPVVQETPGGGGRARSGSEGCIPQASPLVGAPYMLGRCVPAEIPSTLRDALGTHPGDQDTQQGACPRVVELGCL